MAIQRTEFIALDLPGFTAIEKEVEVFSTPEGYFRTGFWSEGAERFTFPAILDLPANTKVSSEQREFFIDNPLVRIHFIIVLIRWTGLAPWEFEFPFPGSLTSTFLAHPGNYYIKLFWPRT